MFGRHWRISSDDFVCPAATELVVRLSWILILIFVLVFHIKEVENLECLGAEYQLTTYYLAVTLGLLTIACCVNLALFLHSARGRIWIEPSEVQPHPRACVEPLLYANIALTVVEFFWTALGAFFAIKDFIRCYNEEHERTVIVAVLVIIGLFYVLLVLKLLVVLCSFRPYAKIRSGEEQSLLDRRMRESELNYLGLRCIVPCTNDEAAIKAFKDIAEILTGVFEDNTLVPSDVMAGLILLSHKAGREKEQERGRSGVVGNTIFNNMGVSLVKVEMENDEVGSILEIASETERIRLDWGLTKHFYNYAAAAYGYMWWMMQSPCSHCCKLTSYLHCCHSCQSHQYHVTADGLCQPNLAAIKAMLEVAEEDIIMFDNRNTIEEVPFLMVADRSTRSLVISIRGTLSLHDMLTDLNAGQAVISEEKREWGGHQGMVRAARNVSRRAEQELGRCLSADQYQGYDVVVTGHSLGAGTATILAFLLRDKYPHRPVRCYAFSPPGGLLSEAAARESEKFTVSLIVGDDVIPRLSLPNIKILSSDIKHAIKSCSLPKYQIFGYGCVGCLCNNRTPLSTELDRLYPPGVVPDSPGIVTSTSSTTTTTTISSTSSSEPCSHPPMFLPGRILHVRQVEDSSYRVTERRKEDFDHILVSRRMILDHFPNHLHRVFNECPDNLNIVPVLV